MLPSAYKPTDYNWSQNDPRWKFKQLSVSGLNFGQAGCAMTATNYIGNRENMRRGLPRPFVRPGQGWLDWMNAKAKACNYTNYLTRGGDIYWDRLCEFWGGTMTHQMHPFVPGESGYILAQVQWGSFHHWIVLLDGDLCRDPWDGQIKYRNQPQWKFTGLYQYYKIVK